MLSGESWALRKRSLPLKHGAQIRAPLARGTLEMCGCVMKEKQIQPTIFHQPHYGFTATLNENLAPSCKESRTNEKAFTSDLDTKIVTTYFMHVTPNATRAESPRGFEGFVLMLVSRLVKCKEKHLTEL